MVRSWWNRLKISGARGRRERRPLPPETPEASKPAPVRDTFCVLAWNHLQVAPNGTVKMCCIASEDISDGKRPMSLYTDTYEDIWNSAYMRTARQGLASGEKISPCRRCFDEEDAVGRSRRTIKNEAWLARPGVSREQLIEAARSNDWRVLERPSYLQLNMGNLCNLACRMCSSQYSSKIERDPVHSKWMPAAYPDVARWRGMKLHLGPRPFFGVSYDGFHEYESDGRSAGRWSSPVGKIKFRVPEGVAIEAIGLSLRTVGCPVPGIVRVNGLEVFDGTFSVEWAQRFELPGINNQLDLEIEIESPPTHIGGRILGIYLLDAWVERRQTGRDRLTNRRVLMRHDHNEGWWAQPEVMFDEILGDPDRLRYIIFQGGEPLLVKEFESILDVLISNGTANEVTFEVVSNITTVTESMLAKLARLKEVILYASIDGIGPVLEYIRYPAVWGDIERNLERFATLKNVKISFATAIQAYNLGDVVNILSYCDRHGIDAEMHFLVGPPYLNVAVLPQPARRAAIDRVAAYLATKELRAANRQMGEYVLKFLREHLSVQFRDQFANFMKFTNDMDVSRGQSFAALYPELLEAFAKDGFQWTNETEFANTGAAPRQSA